MLNIPPISTKFINSLLFSLNLRVVSLIYVILLFTSPYFDHDAIMHHALHVHIGLLDASADDIHTPAHVTSV